MIRVAASTIIKRSSSRFSKESVKCHFPSVASFHASGVRKEEEKPAVVAAAEPEKPPTMMPGWWDPAYTIPVVFTLAIPGLQYQWITINEETQLAGVIIGFVAVVWSQAGDMIKSSLEAAGNKILKETNDLEDEVITKLESMHEELSLTDNMIQDMEDCHALTDETYEKLNASGKIKPLYDYKAQMERIINTIEAEEGRVTEKAKMALMEEATAAVTKQFATSKTLKASALDLAIAKIKGTAKAGEDPVQSCYIQFFKAKAAEASKVDSTAEAAEQRAALISKLNAVSHNENFHFDFGADGKPKMVV